jgi:hypothetical protein
VTLGCSLVRRRKAARKTLPSRSRSWLKVAAVAASALLLSGCVYLRLLELKHQLADFDRNFTLQTTDGLRMNFLHPVLLMDDVRFLGFEPATVRRVGAAEQWHLKWVKQVPAGSSEKGKFEIAFDLTFTEGKLSGLNISESYFAFMPKQLVIGMIKGVGGANVDKRKRTVEGNVDLAGADLPWPTRQSVSGMLGVPTEEHTEGERIIARYHCTIAAEPGHQPSNDKGDIDIRLIFNAASGDMIDSQGRTPLGSIHMTFDHAK